MQKNLDIHLDDVDKQILAILMQDGKTSYAEIGKRLFISQGTVHLRLKKMTDLGLISGFQLQITPKTLGYDLTAFLGVFLEKSSMYNQVCEELKKIPEVVSAHYTTGAYSLFLKIICRDTDHLRETLSNKIQNIQGISRTETLISLDEPIHRPIDIIATLR